MRTAATYGTALGIYAASSQRSERRTSPAGRAGLRFHDLRHTCAALMIADNVHPKVICDRLGHSTIQVTMDRYGHLLPSLEEAAITGLDKT